ncbi:hypothetical protein CH063_15576, partial [Colletotrichum higginsianum]
MQGRNSRRYLRNRALIRQNWIDDIHVWVVLFGFNAALIFGHNCWLCFVCWSYRIFFLTAPKDFLELGFEAAGDLPSLSPQGGVLADGQDVCGPVEVGI